MEFKTIPYEEASILNKIDFEKNCISSIHKPKHEIDPFLEILGLRSIDEDGCYYDSDKRMSLLAIVDEQKYLLAKIKYGI